MTVWQILPTNAVLTAASRILGLIKITKTPPPQTLLVPFWPIRQEHGHAISLDKCFYLRSSSLIVMLPRWLAKMHVFNYVQISLLCGICGCFHMFYLRLSGIICDPAANKGKTEATIQNTSLERAIPLKLTFFCFVFFFGLFCLCYDIFIASVHLFIIQGRTLWSFTSVHTAQANIFNDDDLRIKIPK